MKSKRSASVFLLIALLVFLASIGRLWLNRPKEDLVTLSTDAASQTYLESIRVPIGMMPNDHKSLAETVYLLEKGQITQPMSIATEDSVAAGRDEIMASYPIWNRPNLHLNTQKLGLPGQDLYFSLTTTYSSAGPGASILSFSLIDQETKEFVDDSYTLSLDVNKGYAYLSGMQVKGDLVAFLVTQVNYSIEAEKEVLHHYRLLLSISSGKVIEEKQIQLPEFEGESLNQVAHSLGYNYLAYNPQVLPLLYINEEGQEHLVAFDLFEENTQELSIIQGISHGKLVVIGDQIYQIQGEELETPAGMLPYQGLSERQSHPYTVYQVTEKDPKSLYQLQVDPYSAGVGLDQDRLYYMELKDGQNSLTVVNAKDGKLLAQALLQFPKDSIWYFDRTYDGNEL